MTVGSICLVSHSSLMNPPPTASEHAHQRALVAWFRQTYPDQTLFAIPNGGQRNPATAARLRAEGVLTGVPDLLWLEARCWIEMKTPTGRLAPSQREFLARAEAAGYRTLVGYGFEDAREKMLAIANALAL